MSLDVRAAAVTKPPLTETIRLRANWGERIVTVVATTLAILVVATIAVLMGMA